MCNFLSAIVMRNGDILCNPDLTDSHEDLLDKHNIRDGLAQQDKFARVEFTPPEDPSTLLDLDTWAFKVDEKATPAWLDKGKVRASLAARVKRMFVLDERKLLLGGCWILGGEAYVHRVKSARIYAMLDFSRIMDMRDSSKVGFMNDSSKVWAMLDSSKIDYMRHSSKVEDMYSHSKVGRMFGSSKVGAMYNSSKVDYMHDSSKVVGMFNFSKVGIMYGSSKVDYMQGSSKVVGMFNSSKVMVMHDSSVIPEGKSPLEDNR